MNRKERKGFSISQSIQRGLTETVNAVKNNAGTMRFEIVAISKLEIDPENPRELVLTPDDISKMEIEPLEQEKAREYESLLSLSETIKMKGLINPVVVYKYGEKYRLVAGERRFLASLIAGKTDIQAKVLNEKPKDLKQLQWIENTEREDLSLKDRLGNVDSVIQEHLKEFPDTKVSATLIKELLGVSLQQATSYFAAINASEKIKECIADGLITSLDKVAAIAKIEDAELQMKALEACIAGTSLKNIHGFIKQESQKSHKKGRAPKKINLGSTAKMDAVKRLITFILERSEYQQHGDKFSKINWNDHKHVSKAFKELLDLI